jgi:hypothetical protein
MKTKNTTKIYYHDEYKELENKPTAFGCGNENKDYFYFKFIYLRTLAGDG